MNRKCTLSWGNETEWYCLFPKKTAMAATPCKICFFSSGNTGCQVKSRNDLVNAFFIYHVNVTPIKYVQGIYQDFGTYSLPILLTTPDMDVHLKMKLRLTCYMDLAKFKGLEVVVLGSNLSLKFKAHLLCLVLKLKYSHSLKLYKFLGSLYMKFVTGKSELFWPLSCFVGSYGLIFLQNDCYLVYKL